MRARLSLLLLFGMLLMEGLPATAQQTLYENGPINGNIDAWTLNFGFFVSDSFTISSGPSAVNGLSFGAWLFTGDVLESVDILLSSDPVGGGTRYFSGTVDLAQSGCAVNNFGFNVCTETGSFNGPTMNNGTYWLTMQNAIVNNGDPVYWDENDGVGCNSPGCPSEATESSVGSIPAEAFTILGSAQSSTTSTTGTTPEPSSLLLLGSGAVAAIGLLRRKLL